MDIISLFLIILTIITALMLLFKIVDDWKNIILEKRLTHLKKVFEEQTKELESLKENTNKKERDLLEMKNSMEKLKWGNYEKALISLESKDYSKARQYLEIEKKEKLNRINIEKEKLVKTLLIKSEVEYRDKKLRNSEETLKEILTIDVENVTALHNYVHLINRRKNKKEIINFLEEKFKETKNEQVFLELIKYLVFTKSNNLEKVYAKWSKEIKKNEEVEYYRALNFLVNGQETKATDILKKVNPTNKRSYYKINDLLGDCYFKQKEYGKAVKYYERAIENFPKEITFKCGLCEKDHSEKLSDCSSERGKKLIHQKQCIYCHYVRALIILKEYEKAIKVSKEFLKIKNKLDCDAEKDILYNLTCLYALQEKPDEVKKYLILLKKNYPSEIKKIKEDKDLIKIRNNPKIKHLLE